MTGDEVAELSAEMGPSTSDWLSARRGPTEGERARGAAERREKNGDTERVRPRSSGTGGTAPVECFSYYDDKCGGSENQVAWSERL